MEGADGKPVRSITVWGDQPKYQRDLTVWWGKIDRNDRAMLKSVTRATRAPGKYEVAKTIKTQVSAKTIALDPQTHRLYLSAATPDTSPII